MSAIQLENAVAFTRDADGTTVGTLPPIRVEGKSDAEAIRNMLEVAQSIISGCNSMLSRCEKITGRYEGRTEPVQPFVFHKEDRK